MSEREFKSAQDLASWCGHQEVWSGKCGSDVKFSLHVRMWFLHAASERGATVDQLKDLNWLWQLSSNKAMDLLATIEIVCKETPAIKKKREAEVERTIQTCSSGGWR